MRRAATVSSTAADDNGGGGDEESEKSASECNCWRGVVGGVRAGEVGEKLLAVCVQVM